jgi:hypothetical protein
MKYVIILQEFVYLTHIAYPCSDAPAISSGERATKQTSSEKDMKPISSEKVNLSTFCKIQIIL